MFIVEVLYWVFWGRGFGWDSFLSFGRDCDEWFHMKGTRRMPHSYPRNLEWDFILIPRLWYRDSLSLGARDEFGRVSGGLGEASDLYFSRRTYGWTEVLV